jgi:hypothetical protein
MSRKSQNGVNISDSLVVKLFTAARHIGNQGRRRCSRQSKQLGA